MLGRASSRVFPILPTLVVAAFLGAAAPAAADAPTNGPSATTSSAPNPDAAKHFERGKKLRDEGRCEEAIRELEASIKVQPSIGAYYNLGFCHERAGRKQEAYRAYSVAADLARERNDDRLREIRASAADLLEKSPHVRLALPKPLPAGIRVVVDGKRAEAIDLGPDTVLFTGAGASHEVLVTAPGYEDKKLMVESQRLVPIELRTPPPPGVASPTPSRGTDRDAGGMRWQHWTAIGVGAVGIAGVVVGGIQGMAYLRKRSDVDERLANPCIQNGKVTCPQSSPDKAAADAAVAENNELVNDETSWALRSILPMAFGAIAIAAGVVIWVSAPSPFRTQEASPKAGVRLVPVFGTAAGATNGAALVGTF